MENSNVPEIRFKGFTDAWVQRKFNDIVCRVSAQSNSNALPKVEFEDIVSGEGRLNKDISNKFDKRKGIIFEPGNILYGKLRPYLKNWLLADFKGVALGDFWVFESIESSPIFNYYLIQTEKYQEVASLSTGTKMPRADWKIVSEMDFSTPYEISEQTAVGIFFRTLDDTITLYQRKLSGLKKLKAGYLQQMFPQSGERVPRVRFKGFTGDWVERKLDELFTQTVREVPKPNEPYWRLSVRSHAKGTFKQYVDDPTKIEMDKLYVVKENDLIINITFAWEHAIAIAVKEDDGLLVSHRFPTFLIDKSDRNFIRYLVSSKNFRKKLELISPGGAGRNRVLNKKDFMQLTEIVPSADEQTTIGNFFFYLDEQITDQATKLEKLKQLKAAYLQKMFI